MKKVLIISNNSGAGHRQTARILAQTLRGQGWNPEVISIYRDLFLDHFHIFGVEGEEIYNRLLLTREVSPLIYGLFFISAYYLILQRHWEKFNRRLVDFWQQQQPDLVISVIPLLNQLIATSLARLGRPIPFAIILTDLFEFDGNYRLKPPGVWFVSDDRTYTIVGTETAYQQVVSNYISDTSRVFKLSGNIVNPQFLTKPDFDRPAERQTLGLDPNQPVGLFLYGGFAPNRLLYLAKRLNRLEKPVQYIFICGNNEILQQRLSLLETGYHKVVLGYTWDVPYYMHLSDFLIGKAGPGTIMEGIAAGLPLLIDMTRQNLIHESHNIKWVEQHRIGLRFDTTAQLLDGIQQLTSSEVYVQLKTNVSQFENRAALEIPQVIDTIMDHFHRSTAKRLFNDSFV